MNKKKKLSIGLSVGTTSVGWSLVEENENGEFFNIVNAGPRTFPDVIDPNNGHTKCSIRGETRRSRRVYSRRKNRRKTLTKILVKYGFIENEKEIKMEEINNPQLYGFVNSIEMRCFGLKEKFNNENGSFKNKIISCLFNYINKRGWSYKELTDEVNVVKKKESEKSQLDKFVEKLISEKNEKHPSEMIYEFYKKFGFYKSTDLTGAIHNSQWINEFLDFAKMQELDNEMVKEILRLFNSYDYALGPNVLVGGNGEIIKNYSPYGRVNENDPTKLYNQLWEKNIGRCSCYKEEFRGGAKTVFAEMFNFLNSMAMFYTDGIKENKLCLKERIALMEKIRDNKIPVSGFKLKTLFKNVLDKDKIENTIDFPNCGLNEVLDSEGRFKENKIEKVNNYGIILNFLMENNLFDENKDDIFDIGFMQKLNRISDLFFKIKIKEKLIIELNKVLAEEFGVNDLINDENLFSLKNMSETHSLSYRAMSEYIDYWVHCEDERVLTWSEYRNIYIKNDEENEVIHQKYIDKDFIDDLIVSPTVKRSFRQTINVLNKILKLYGDDYEISYIGIKVAKEKNTKEEKAAITKERNKNEKKIDLILDEVKVVDIDRDSLTEKQKLKLKLWYDQKFEDIYTGGKIDLKDVLDESDSLLEAEHIIPFKIINDNSYDNRVLCFKKNNTAKGKRTPCQWLKAEGNFDSFKERVLNNENISLKKQEILLVENLEEVLDNFTGRQLVDTRYACVVIKKCLEKFFKNNTYYAKKPKINTIRGSLVRFFENEMGIVKNKNEYFSCAVDASVVAYLAMDKDVRKRIDFYSFYFKNKLFKRYKVNGMEVEGESTKNDNIVRKINLEEDNWFRLDKNIKLMDFSKQLKKRIENRDFQYSRMMVTKNNVSLGNDTVYSTKWDFDPRENSEAVAEKFSWLNIIEKDNATLAKYFGKNANDKYMARLLCLNDDPSLYQKLNDIFVKYNDGKKNPFIAYMVAQNKAINEFNVKFLQLDENTRVKKLKLFMGQKKASSVIILSGKHENSKKDDNFSIMESLNCLSCRLYKDRNNKIVAIPINCLVAKYDQKEQKMVLVKEKLDKVLISKNIDINAPFEEFKNGTVIINNETKEMFYTLGSTTNNKMEIKNLRFFDECQQRQLTINQIYTEYSPVELGIMLKGKTNIVVRNWKI